ncbi:hypothetical protein [Streptomyces blastmyceticus]|uniref:Uncharacterized protein n=1 Tax=Streptomyces blastmyceticus TaxID=68180 RepID=A0ABN0XZI9_9ACTN
MNLRCALAPVVAVTAPGAKEAACKKLDTTPAAHEQDSCPLS